MPATARFLAHYDRTFDPADAREHSPYNVTLAALETAQLTFLEERKGPRSKDKVRTATLTRDAGPIEETHAWADFWAMITEDERQQILKNREGRRREHPEGGPGDQQSAGECEAD